MERIFLEKRQKTIQFFLIFAWQLFRGDKKILVIAERDHARARSARKEFLPRNRYSGVSAAARRISFTNSDRYTPSSSWPIILMTTERNRESSLWSSCMLLDVGLFIDDLT